MLSINDDDSLIAHLSRLKATDHASRMSVTAKEQFEKLYDETRSLIAAIFNRAEEEERFDSLMDYQKKTLVN